jgi:hypothetical protein
MVKTGHLGQRRAPLVVLVLVLFGAFGCEAVLGLGDETALPSDAGVDGGGAMTPDSGSSHDVSLDHANADASQRDSGKASDAPRTSSPDADATMSRTDAPGDAGRTTDASDAKEQKDVSASSESGYDASGPIVFVQGSAGAGSGDAAASAMLSSTTPHDTLIVSTLNSLAISDSQHNTFTSVISSTANDVGVAAVFVAFDIPGGDDTLTLSGSDSPYLYVDEYAGLVSFDVGSWSTGETSSGTDGMVSGMTTTTGSNELLFGFAVTGGNCSAGTGYTLRTSFEGNVTEDRVVSSPGSYQATATWDNSDSDWAVFLAAFKGH